MKKILTVLIILSIWSCNKDEGSDSPQPTIVTNCSANSGNFDITIGGQTYTMALNDQSQFTILYNWYDAETSSFIVNTNDQNNKQI